jgi:hypothetical protein
MDPDPFENEIRQGQTKIVKLNITNNILADLNVSINYSEFERFMLIEKSSFVLEARDSELLSVELFANYDEVPEVYIGKIDVYVNGILNELDTVLEVKERRSLFDIITKMIEKRVKPGKNASAIINMSDIGDIGPVNATLYYAIRDFSNNTLVSNEEGVFIDGFLSVEKSLQLPKDAKDRNYVFYSKISYEEFFATSSDTFSTRRIGYLILFIIVILIIIAIVVTVIILHRRNKSLTKKTNENQD